MTMYVSMCHMSRVGSEEYIDSEDMQLGEICFHGVVLSRLTTGLFRTHGVL